MCVNSSTPDRLPPDLPERHDVSTFPPGPDHPGERHPRGGPWRRHRHGSAHSGLLPPLRHLEALGPAAFADDRAELANDPAGAHPFDRPEHQGASILLVNRNFGCGSSREHAPQALMRWGIRAVVGESFAEIFFGNCLALGLPCAAADHDTMLAIQAVAEANPGAPVSLELASCRLSAGGETWQLGLAAGPRQMLLSGQWDATGQLLAQDEALAATAARLPYLNAFA